MRLYYVQAVRCVVGSVETEENKFQAISFMQCGNTVSLIWPLLIPGMENKMGAASFEGSTYCIIT